ncbi:MAG: hypothetical protein Rsou_1842 [Candidatus Ruthia sp. Asou_11_S2]|nr:hypothetical protein [Candidatus Ruthia sp. Asou_11_S2]
MKSYLQISCEDHSAYELAIMRSQSIKVLIDETIQVIRPKNIITKSTEEFLIFLDEQGVEQELRVDKITIKE